MNAKFANETRQLIKKRKKAPKSGLTLNDLYEGNRPIAFHDSQC